MTTERELLELAAKAAGIVIECDADKAFVFPSHYSGGFSVLNDKGGSSLWNPLTDDGDALRLAVKLGIQAGYSAFSGEGVAVWSRGCYTVREYGPDDPYAATRRAIVRAAAEIGKSMP